jgi:protein involved in polysaccharide export with SLBB domain
MSTMNSIWRFIVVSLVLAILAGDVAIAQESSSNRRNYGSARQQVPTPTEEIPALQYGEIALDKTIDPDTYILGPGDVLGVSGPLLAGAYVQSMISPDGTLAVHGRPLIKVVGMSLTEAREYVNEQWGKKGIEVYIGLMKMRKVRVSVGGAVENPGRYIVTADQRATDLVELAGGVTRDAHSRRGEVIFQDGTKITVDFLRYERSGNLEYNPQLTNGAHLIVYEEDDDVASAVIGGAVGFEDRYAWMQGDDLQAYVDLAGGLISEMATDTLIISHFEKQHISSIDTFNLAFLDLDSLLSHTKIRPSDVIQFVRKQSFAPASSVFISGEVRRPGVYAIENGKTTLSEVINQAGGFGEFAWLSGSRVYKRGEDRNAYYEVSLKVNSSVVPFDSYVDEAILRYDLLASEKDYVPVDFTSIFGNDETEPNAENDIVLYDGYIIEIPQRSYLVLVGGQVQKPGYVEYVENQPLKYYIKAAGGYTSNAWKGEVRRVPYESNQVDPIGSGGVIAEGDYIFVPEKSSEFKWERIRDILSIAAQLTTLAALILSLP